MGWLNLQGHTASYRDMRHIALVLGILAASIIAALLGHGFLQRKSNSAELQRLAEQVIAGTEKSIDYAILSMFDLEGANDDLCSEAGKNYLKQAVHFRSVVKDVRVLDQYGQIKCSAFPDMLVDNANSLSLASGLSARNSDYALFNVDFGNRKILAVAKHAADSDSILVLIDVEAQLFAAFPAAIRDHAFGSLQIEGQGLSASSGQMLASGQPHIPARATSQRFPIVFDIALDAKTFVAWNQQFKQLAIVLGFILGGLLSAFTLRELRRPLTAAQQILCAIEQGEIQPYFQPILCAAKCAISSCEVLARWIKPDGTVISPAHFIPMAETTGTIIPMTRKLMQITFRQLKNILRENVNFTVAFNITPNDFAAKGFVEEILSVAGKNHVLPRQITLEITEREGFDDIKQMAAAVQQARKAGFCVSLDDTGTGHNGLSHVQDISADVIKIDKKFVDLVGQAPSADAIIDMLVGLARRLSMKTVAEGIETEEQLMALRAAGVDCFQGYLISKPLSAPQFIAFYRELNPLHRTQHQPQSPYIFPSHAVPA